MATDFTVTVQIPAGPEQAFAMLTDHGYLVWKQEQMHASDVSASVAVEGDLVTAISDRKFPAELPAAAKAVVGDSVNVHEVHRWGPPQSDGSRSGEIEVAFPGVPLTMSGRITLTPAATGSVLQVLVSARCALPFVGGKLEAIAGEQLQRAGTKETELVPIWLARS